MNLLTKNPIFIAICFILCAGLLAACGKKPSTVKAPPHVAQDSYPQTYPAPAPIPKN